MSASRSVGRKGNSRLLVGRARCLAREVRHIGDGKGSRLRSLFGRGMSSGRPDGVVPVLLSGGDVLASVMQTIPSANTQAPVVMVAEFASRLMVRRASNNN